MQEARMGRPPSSESNNPLIEKLLRKHDLKYVRDLTRPYPGVNANRLYEYNKINGRHRLLENIRNDAKSLGFASVDDFLDELLKTERDSL